MYNITIASSDRELEDAFFVRHKVFVEEQGVPSSLELDELDKTADHFVVYDADSPIGAGRFREVQTGIGKIERVCILADFRGKKLGKLIMNALENHGEAQGFEKVVLNAQSNAIPFYEKIGYSVTSPEFMDADIPHRSMEKVIQHKKRK